MVKKLYNCMNCPAYCCSYTLIPVTDFDLKRLARHLGISEKKAEANHTKYGDKINPRVLRHSADEHFVSSCALLDKETRRCTVYEGRPGICRAFPTQSRCGYYEFLKFERGVQDDRDWVATTN